jgi:hypothetical protein
MERQRRDQLDGTASAAEPDHLVTARAQARRQHPDRPPQVWPRIVAGKMEAGASPFEPPPRTQQNRNLEWRRGDRQPPVPKPRPPSQTVSRRAQRPESAARAGVATIAAVAVSAAWVCRPAYRWHWVLVDLGWRRTDQGLHWEVDDIRHARATRDARRRGSSSAVPAASKNAGCARCGRGGSRREQ